MSEEKLSSDEVPPKFSEWLLAMGCPPEDVPPLEKLSEMCRGQYYMVWRSLMEHVGPKDTILNKRLQVFNNDVLKCQKKNLFNELDVNMPKELSAWGQHTELKEEVDEAEARVREQREELQQLVDKVSTKLAHRNLSRRRLEEARRRSWMLQQASAELGERRANLHETKTIADSLCCLDDTQDVEIKLDKCMCVLSRPAHATATGRAGVSLQSFANPVASSSIASTNSDYDAEENIKSLVKCRGDVVFKQLFERRAGLCAMADTRDAETKGKYKNTPQSVLAHTSALQCTLALEAVKNRVSCNHTNKRLAAMLSELSNYLSGESCELLVLRCQRAYKSARMKALRAICHEIQTRDGIFAAVAGEHDSNAAKDIHNIDKSILSRRDELKRLIVTAAVVERKTQIVKDNLIAIFNSLHSSENEQIKSQTSINSPPTSISTLRQFYEERRDKPNAKVELSMNLDVSDNCSYNLTENESPKFIDELKMYLNKFSLEKNRQLVLESGEKVWIFETVQSSLERVFARWQEDDVITSLVCPSVSLSCNLARLADLANGRTQLEAKIRALEDGGNKRELSLDISSATEEEQKTLERVKKILNDDILNLQKTGKTLDVGIENLTLWSGNTVKKYISGNRTVNGRSYWEYERAYLECLRL